MAICSNEPSSADELCVTRETTHRMANTQISRLSVEAYAIGECVVSRSVVARGVAVNVADNEIILREMRHGRRKKQSKGGYDQ